MSERMNAGEDPRVDWGPGEWFEESQRLEAEVERLREALNDVRARAGWFIDRGATDFSYEEISERLALALQDLSVIRRKASRVLEPSSSVGDALKGERG